MPKPRRRRRFFALEGRFEVDDTGELQGIAEPPPNDPPETDVLPEENEFVAGENDLHPAVYAEEPAAPTAPEDDALPPAFRLNRAPRTRPAQKRVFSRRTLLVSLLCLVSGMLSGYWFARSGQKPVAVDASAVAPKVRTTLTAADEGDLDAAYTARHSNRFAEAADLFGALQRRYPGWGPIEVEVGRTLFYENKSLEASVALKAAAEKGWNAAEADFLLGVLNKTRKSFPDAETSFAAAVALDPTQPEYYFFWGECLREQGKLLDATAKFRSALLRNQYETATGLYRAKLWLCSIEADQAANDGVNAEIDGVLKQSRPAMEALVAAAARDVKAGDFGAATEHLSRARQGADATVFRYILSDPLFVPLYSRPEFVEFFGSATPAVKQETNATASPPPPSVTTSGSAPSVQPSASAAKAKKP